MTDRDRDLLDWAAKAIGCEFRWFTTGPGLVGIKPCWNPLTDDGDAFRLAVEADIELYQANNDNQNVSVAGYPIAGRILYIIEPHGRDKHAATRRAIVRAAAEIGKAMK